MNYFEKLYESTFNNELEKIARLSPRDNKRWWTDEAQKILIGDKKYPTSAWVSEIGELVDAIKNRDVENIREEIGDVLFVPQMMIHQKTGLNLPLIGAQKSTQKFMDRIDVWDQMMGRHGLKIQPELLEGGSNFRKPKKIRAAFLAAGKPLTDDEIREFEPVVGGFEVPL